MGCRTCQYRQSIPWDCHIGCSNPPVYIEQIGSGGKERYTQAEERAAKNHSVVRCIWPGSGSYPICFDENTVFGCCNYKADGK